ncbi:MAG: HAD family hydrolase [Bacteroidales bacterium]|nr:HAD family hydrolase [Bacteroidales bacterium]
MSHTSVTDYSKIRLIGFDADDTLWRNSVYFVQAEKRLADLLSPWLSAETLHSRLVATETDNMPWYGYGVMAYTLSLIETAARESHYEIPAKDIERILEIGKWMLGHPVELYDGVLQILPVLEQHYPLVIVTKGDMLDQERKLRKSGLMPYFHHIEIVSEKNEDNYRDLLTRLKVRPEEFLMVGNSLKSDIAPVLAVGGQAVHIITDDIWEYERSDKPALPYREISRIDELLPILGLPGD